MTHPRLNVAEVFHEVKMSLIPGYLLDIYWN